MARKTITFRNKKTKALSKKIYNSILYAAMPGFE
jgi:hypothetical protein